jgi:hypothetical protein
MTYKFCFQILGGNSNHLLGHWKARATLGESPTSGPYAEERPLVIGSSERIFFLLLVLPELWIGARS